ncbi:MAG TPA: crosslink repair DNA glycosylase YcaQ family protein, partial [Glaciihabitans sp.]|nr:crosslink repair DNA glycosylase YcaQ family protein [Glaciihabitans sp.]
MNTEVSPALARRIALAAQGFGRPRPSTVGLRQINDVAARLGLLQLDSVNVFERSHYLPVFARLGAYNKADLDRVTFGNSPRYVEYWAHVASLIPLDTWPLWRWKMAALRAKDEKTPDHWIHSNREMLDWLRAELADKGPLPASKIEHDANQRRGPWWGWSDVKQGLEVLFSWGEVVSAGRKGFERIYGLTDSVIPQHLVEKTISERDAVKQLLRLASRAHGIGTVGDIADYYRIKKTVAAPLLEELADDGELARVTVSGWDGGGRARPV